MRHLLLSPLGLALALALCELGNDAYAAERLTAPPEFLAASSDTRWQAVGDDVLSHQTGKGAGGAMVSGLVLELLSQWQMPNGASASAHGTLTVSTNANNALSAQVRTSAQATDGGMHGNGNANSLGAGANPQASATGGQNVSINGVSQITQVAGNGNVGANSTVIEFTGSSASTLASDAAPRSGQGASPYIGTNNPTTSATSTSGNVKAAISFANGGVAVTVRTPAGVATQTISPSLAQSGGAIAQLLQIAGNGQVVANQLKLSVQTQPMTGALMRQLGVQQALRNAALLRH